MPKNNPLQVALTILLVVIVVVVIVLFATGCTPRDERNKIREEEKSLSPANQQSVIYADGDTTEMELVGCVKGTCTYTFHKIRRCFLTIGQANKMNTDSWMFDLECPG